MKSTLEKISNCIHDYKTAQRIVVLTCDDEGIDVERVVYYPRTKKIHSSAKKHYDGLLYTLLSQRGAIQKLLYTVWFPFSFHVIIIAPHHKSTSISYQCVYERPHPKEQLTLQEINSYLSQTIGKRLEENKKYAVNKNNADDIEVLLALHAVTRVWIDGELWDERSNIWETTPKTITCEVVQTFIDRKLFTTIGRLLPKRATIQSCAEEGFWMAYVAINIYAPQYTKIKKQGATTYAHIQKERTDVYHAEKGTILFHDSFRFGLQTIYEVWNAALDLDFRSFEEIFTKFQNGDVSEEASAYIEKLIKNELTNLTNGIDAFKKTSGATQSIIEGGVISKLLVKSKKYTSQTINQKWYTTLVEPYSADTEISPETYTHIHFAMHTPTHHEIQDLATKCIRWLIPHNIER